MKVIVLVVVLALTACLPPQTRRVSRSAIVPHMTPTLMNGAPMETPGQVILTAPSVAHTTLAAVDADVAGEVVGTQLGGVLRARAGDHVALGLLFEQGLDRGARALQATEAPIDADGPTGRGVSITGIMDTGDPRWHLGLDLEFEVWTIPWIEYSTCVENCQGPIQSVTHGTDAVPQLALGMTPTYQDGKLRAWGGASVRNHPTLRQKGVEYGTDRGGDVEAGAMNVVVSAGAEVELGAGVMAGLTVYQVLNGSPARYGPSLAATLTLPLGSRRR